MGHLDSEGLDALSNMEYGQLNRLRDGLPGDPEVGHFRDSTNSRIMSVVDGPDGLPGLS